MYVRKAISGDRPSIEWICIHFLPLMRAQAEYRLGSKLRSAADPEDIAHDAWLVMMRKLADIEPRNGSWSRGALAFAARIVLNNVNNLYRRRIRGKGTTLPVAGGDVASDEHVAVPVVDDATGVVTRVGARDLMSRISLCLESLTPDEREAFVLRGIENEPNADVASLLKTKPATIAKRYCRAKERLRNCLPRALLDELADD